MRLLLLLSVVCRAVSVIDTEVYVNFTLVCDRQESFSYGVHIIEDDDILSDDKIAFLEGTGSQKVTWEIIGKDNGDPGAEYEFVFMVYHTCRGDENHNKVELRPHCKKNTTRCNYLNVWINLSIPE